MKPAWDALMEEWAESEVGLVADVDCTAAGESLCQEHGVKGYPTIKSRDTGVPWCIEGRLNASSVFQGVH